MPRDPQALESRVSILNVGTRILQKDLMDLHLRSMGDIVTHYAPTVASALRVFRETQIHIMISEVELADGSVCRLHRELGGGTSEDDLYFVLAIEDRNPKLLALADELEAKATLCKPFSAVDLNAMMEKYAAWQVLPKDPWLLLVTEARLATREHRFSDAEQHFRDAIEAAPSNPLPLLRAAEYFLTKPDYDMVAKLLTRATAIHPKFTQGYALQAQAYYVQRALREAEDNLRKAQEISPLNPERTALIGTICLDRSIESCKAALRLDPNLPATQLLLGKLLGVQRDYVGSLRELDKILPTLRDQPRNEAQTFGALARKLGGFMKTK